MSISSVNYDPNSQINHAGRTYSSGMDMAFVGYRLDQFGREVIDDKTKNLKVRSYYTVGTNEPNLQNMPLTFEDVVKLLSTKRATILETEITPMAEVIQRRNNELKELGTMLAAVSKTQTQMESDDDHGTDYDCVGLCDFLKKHFTPAELQRANLSDFVNKSSNSGASAACPSSKSDGYIASANQLIKSKIDTLNNEAQTDMMRMENLVSKRDESYSLATDLSGTIQDGRTSIINNIGG